MPCRSISRSQARNSSTEILYSSHASSIGSQPPRMASMTAALRRTVHRWWVMAVAARANRRSRMRRSRFPVAYNSLLSQPNANRDDANQKQPCQERGELIWRHVGHGRYDGRATLIIYFNLNLIQNKSGDRKNRAAGLSWTPVVRQPEPSSKV